MARARNLKPGFFKDAKVVACSFEARLLFQGLWCLADYMGRLKYVPIEVKMEVFPADDVDVNALMHELANQKLIVMYHDHSGAALVQIVNFSRHQNPHINERQGRDKKPLPCLPSPEECESPVGGEKGDTNQEVENALRVLREHYQSNPADSPFPLTDSLLRTHRADGSPNGELELGVDPPDGESEPPPKPRRSKPKRPIPDDFELNSDMVTWARENGFGHLDLTTSTSEFVDYWRGQGDAKADWTATWRNRIRQIASRTGPGTQPRGPLSAVDRVRSATGQ